jgi:hypothetical protein
MTIIKCLPMVMFMLPCAALNPFALLSLGVRQIKLRASGRHRKMWVGVQWTFVVAVVAEFTV